MWVKDREAIIMIKYGYSLPPWGCWLFRWFPYLPPFLLEPCETTRRNAGEPLPCPCLIGAGRRDWHKRWKHVVCTSIRRRGGFLTEQIIGAAVFDRSTLPVESGYSSQISVKLVSNQSRQLWRISWSVGHITYIEIWLGETNRNGIGITIMRRDWNRCRN